MSVTAEIRTKGSDTVSTVLFEVAPRIGERIQTGEAGNLRSFRVIDVIHYQKGSTPNQFDLGLTVEEVT